MVDDRSILELLQRFGDRGIRLNLKDERLQVTATKGVLNADDRAEIALRKIEIISLIRNNGAPWTAVEAIEQVDRGGPLSLSFAQQRLWFLDRMEGAGATYCISGALRLNGRLNTVALIMALDRIIARHEALRTHFIEVAGEAKQVITPADEQRFALRTLDLNDRLPGQREIEVRRLAEEEAAEPFNLAVGPLIRGRLLRLGVDEHALLLTMHHIVSDGWSMNVLIKEVTTLYEAFSQGRPDPLPPLAVQYADYAAWQRTQLFGERQQEHLAYWGNVLAGAPVLLELPTDRPRPAMRSLSGGSVPVTLDAAFAARLRALSRSNDATLFMALLTGWAALMSRLSGQNEVVIGTPVANRPRAELEGLIGFFVNTLALRVDFAGELNFLQAVARVRTVALAAYAHQEAPFERVVEVVQPPRSLAYSPVFQVMFAWQNTPHTELRLPGLTLETISTEHRAARFDLTLSLEESADGDIVGYIEYANDLFTRSTIERWAGHFVTLLEGLVAQPERRLDRMPLLSETERRQLLLGFNNTNAELPRDVCVHELFERQVAATPDATALVFEEQSVTYDELNVYANRLAHHLRDLGVGPDTMVAICVERSIEMVVGMLGILKSGGAFVPIDPVQPTERIRFILADTDASVLLTQASLLDKLPRHRAHALCLDGYSTLLTLQPTSNPVRTNDPTDLAYCIYTSGSAGQPKGVLVCGQSLVNLFTHWNVKYPSRPNERFSFWTSFGFDVSLWEWLLPLTCGASVAIPTELTRQDPLRFLHWAREVAVSTAYLPPHIARMLPELVERGASIPSRVLLGVEPLNERTVFAVSDKIVVVNGYGPTEATVYASAYTENLRPLDRNLPIGRPIANTQIYILDTHSQPVPIGVTGELHIGGAGVARGYLNRPELTAERFVSDPFSGELGARMYKSGDLARWLPDGNIEFLGRNDLQVKIRGFRIELGEIESQLLTHAAVRESVVVAHEASGGNKRLVAYVVPRGTKEPAMAESLREYLQTRLPAYMVPSAFVTLAALPLTSNGKLDRKTLPAPDLSALSTAAYEAPQGESEIALAAIWRDVLGVERVGRHDDFFALGGHSLLTIRLAERIVKVLGVRLTVADLYTHPTLSMTAAMVDTQRSITPMGNRPCLAGVAPVLLADGPEQTPLFLVHAGDGLVDCYTVLANRLTGWRPIYGLSATDPAWSVPPERSVEELARRHRRTVDRIQPVGPLLLGAYCAGGIVVQEMVRQWEEEGRDVAWCGIIDGCLPDSTLLAAWGSPDPALAWYLFAADEAEWFGLPVDPDAVSPERLRGLEATDIPNAVFAALAVAGHPMVGSQNALLLDEFLMHQQMLFILTHPHERRRCRTALTVVPASEHVHDPQFTTAWQDLSPQAVITPVTGSHLSIIKGRDLSGLVGTVRSGVDAAVIRRPVEVV